jgi:hypothetical protein
VARFFTCLLVVASLLSLAAPASARFRIPGGGPRPVAKPVETSSSPSRSYGGGYSSGSSSSSDDGESRSGFDFRLICLVIVALAMAVRIIAGVIGVVVWMIRGITG